MGYILKKGGGAGTGDATAANQVLQLAQDATESTLQALRNEFKDNNSESVFLNPATESVFKTNTDESVFKDGASDSAFLTGSLNSVFKDGGNSLLKIPIYNDSAFPFQVASFTAGSLTATVALLQAFLNGTTCYIVNISFSQSALSHDILVVYKT